MRQHGIKILGEAVLLAAVGLGIGLTANASSESGIRLDRDYFPSRGSATPPKMTGSPKPTGRVDSQGDGGRVQAGGHESQTGADGEAAGDAAADTPQADAGTDAARMSQPVEAPPSDQLPYQTISHQDVVEVYSSPEYEFEQYIIIDARDDSHYLEGHVPGAYQLDHYRLEQYLPTVLPACEMATRIVIYCNGGKCEDSELAAYDLMDAGVDPNKICVYLGGATAWAQAGLPLERGDRLSQDLYYPSALED